MCRRPIKVFQTAPLFYKLMCHICLQSSLFFKRNSSLSEIVSHLLSLNFIYGHLMCRRSLRADSAPENATGPQQSVLEEKRFLTGVRMRF